MTKNSSQLSTSCFEIEEQQQLKDLLHLVVREIKKGYENE